MVKIQNQCTFVFSFVLQSSAQGREVLLFVEGVESFGAQIFAGLLPCVGHHLLPHLKGL